VKFLLSVIFTPEKPMPKAATPKLPKVLDAQLATSSGSLATINSTTAPQFAASGYLATDLFEASSTLPSLDTVTYESRLETIKGQQRAVHIVRENLNLNRSILQAEGASVQCENEGVSNDIKRQDLATNRVKLQQSQVKTGIESARLTELSHDLNGYTQQANIKGQMWEVKLEGLMDDLQVAQNLLQAKKQALQQQLKVA
jgi:hypothetical protein